MRLVLIRYRPCEGAVRRQVDICAAGLKSQDAAISKLLREGKSMHEVAALLQIAYRTLQSRFSRTGAIQRHVSRATLRAIPRRKPRRQTRQQDIEKVLSCLPPPVLVKGDTHSCTTLVQRMAEVHVLGVSVAVIHNGAIEWALGFGVVKTGGPAVTTDTLFQAGSISKPLAAMAALHQVQNKKLSLDADVNSELISWKVPESPAANGKPVTLRELLTHTAGFTVHGFPGYGAKAPVPSLIQVLNGEKPANTAPIRVESEPGSKWNYSGGGYIVRQQLLLDTTKQSFPKLMHDTVLGPIGMTHNTYEQPLPAALQSVAATPYRPDGSPVPGGAHTYPGMTAAGLWTTSSELVRRTPPNSVCRFLNL